MDCATLKDMIGLTMTSVKQVDDEVIFLASTGDRFKMYHCQDCCEDVAVESIQGDLDLLVGSPITGAEEEITKKNNAHDDSSTTTRYTLSTDKGTVVITWLGSSNGYYSEDVDFVKLEEEK